MGCFCATTTALRDTLERLSAENAAGAQPGQSAVSGEQAAAVSSAAAHLAARGLPTDPWQPAPAWLETVVPTPRLDPNAVATLCGLASMRAEAQSQLGVDLLAAGANVPVARIVATMNARLAATTNAGAPAIANIPDPSAWQQLADQNDAADRVLRQAASTASAADYTHPAGQPMAIWKPFLRQIRAMAPLVAAASQLDVSLADAQAVPARLAAAVRALRAVEVPPLEDPLAVSRLLGLLSALDRLQQSLGPEPLRDGLGAVQQAVGRKVTDAAQALADTGPPPDVPYCPTALAPPEVVAAACSDGGRQLADIAWRVPPTSTLPAIQTLSLAAALVGAITATTASSPIRSSPCAGCDARQVLAAASAGAPAAV